MSHHEEIALRAADGRSRADQYRIDWSKPDSVGADDLVSYVTAHYHDGKIRRAGWEAQSANQLAFARGQQAKSWNPTTESLDDLCVDANTTLDDRFPVSVNRITTVVLHKVAMLIGRPITWSVEPQTQQDDDVGSAKLNTALMKYYWRAGPDSMLSGFLSAAWLLFTTGIVYASARWNPYRGEVDRFDPADYLPEGEATAQPAGLVDRAKEYLAGLSQSKAGSMAVDAGGGVQLPAGDLDTEWPSGFEITEPAGCRDIGDAEWLLYSRLRTLQWLNERYGDKAERIKPDSRSGADPLRVHEDAALYGSHTGERPDGAMNDQVVVHELWRPRSLTSRAGFFAVVAGGRVMHSGRHPYAHGRLPFVAFRERPEPSFFRPGCTVRDLMPLQVARNRNRSKWHGHLNTVMDPRILAERDAGLPHDAFTPNSPKVVRLKEGGLAKVRAWEPPHLPSEAFHIDSMDLQDMADISGVHNSTAGRPEHSNQSGRHAALMRQGDANATVPTRMLVEAAASKLGAQMLMLLWQYVREPTERIITGEGGAREVLEFVGSDMSQRQPTGPYEFNVKAVLAPETNQEQLVAEIDMLIERGVLNPAQNEQHRMIVMRLLGDRYTGDLDMDAIHRTNAQHENREAIAGRGSLIASRGDYHAMHIDEHERYQTTGDYRQALRKDPAIADRLEMHIREHMVWMADRALRPAAIAEVTKARLGAHYGLVPPPPAEAGGRSPAPANRSAARPKPARPPGAKPGPSLRVAQ